MADVYRFKVRLRELEDYIWRDIEITSVSTVAKLVYAILAAFEAEGSHLFCMKFGDERYEIVFDDFYKIIKQLFTVFNFPIVIALIYGDNKSLV